MTACLFNWLAGLAELLLCNDSIHLGQSTGVERVVIVREQKQKQHARKTSNLAKIFEQKLTQHEPRNTLRKTKHSFAENKK